MISYATFSNIGTCDNNEDAYGIYEKDDKKLFILCDGLGGHGRGEVASALVKETFGNIFLTEESKPETFLDKAFELSQATLLLEQEAKHAKSEMKTTAVCLYLDEDKVYCSHIGDSRLYYFHKGKCVKRTIDHSVPQMLVLSGDIKEKEIRNHPDRNRLLKVMGTEWSRKPYEIEQWKDMDDKTSYLLLSDGFWELIDEKTMCKLLKKSKSAEEWVESMAAVVLENGAGKHMDNYTAIAIFSR